MKQLGNFFSSVKLGYNHTRNGVLVQKNRSTILVAKKMYDLGFVRGFSLNTIKVYKMFLFLKYYKNSPLFYHLKYVCSASKLKSVKVRKIKERHCHGNVLTLFSTTQGLCTSIECVVLNQGGVLLFIM